MRELRSCDFCDAEAVGAFEIVPPELEPTEAEQRRVVPCADCKDRLETLLEPLLARAGAESGAGTETGPADGDRDSTADDGTDGSEAVVATADESTEKRPRTTSPNATVSGSPAESDDSETARPAGEAASDSDPGSDAETGLEDGITFERDERASDDDADPADEDSAEPADGATEAGDASNVAAAPDADDDADDTDRSTPDSESTSSRKTTSPPTAYNKVVRLLRNREFPMKRTAVEELAAGAYDLENHEVEAIVDYAVEDGEFVEKGGLLRRP